MARSLAAWTCPILATSYTTLAGTHAALPFVPTCLIPTLNVATGRTFDLSGLGLESAGLDSTARSIQVDERMRASDGIWAIGDVTGKGMFTQPIWPTTAGAANHAEAARI